MLYIEKIPIGILETHVTHACNLTCESCGHYSNQGHKGMVAVAVADDWMRQWRRRLSPEYISVLGGEPTLHKQLPEWIEMTRRNWPSSIIRITTNGFFLKNHPSLPAVLEQTSTELKISIHHQSPAYQEKMKEIMALVEEWRANYKFRLIVAESVSKWFRQYKGFGDEMMPYEDNDPEASYSTCEWRGCWQLHEGYIWKCAPLAYLPMQKKRHNLDPAWDYYLTYKPLSPDASLDEMKRFFSLRAEPFCAMCPARPDHFEPSSPLIPLSIRKRS